MAVGQSKAIHDHVIIHSSDLKTYAQANHATEPTPAGITDIDATRTDSILNVHAKNINDDATIIDKSTDAMVSLMTTTGHENAIFTILLTYTESTNGVIDALQSHDKRS